MWFLPFERNVLREIQGQCDLTKHFLAITQDFTQLLWQNFTQMVIFYMTLDKQGCNVKLACVTVANNREAVIWVQIKLICRLCDKLFMWHACAWASKNINDWWFIMFMNLLHLYWLLYMYKDKNNFEQNSQLAKTFLYKSIQGSPQPLIATPYLGPRVFRYKILLNLT